MKVELRRELLNLALLEALECGSLVRGWKQTIAEDLELETNVLRDVYNAAR